MTIPWDSLQLQFGCSYKNPRHLKRRFLKYLKSVISYYPEVRLATQHRRRGPSPEAVSDAGRTTCFTDESVADRMLSRPGEVAQS